MILFSCFCKYFLRLISNYSFSQVPGGEQTNLSIYFHLNVISAIQQHQQKMSRDTVRRMNCRSNYTFFLNAPWGEQPYLYFKISSFKNESNIIITLYSNRAYFTAQKLENRVSYFLRHKNG